MGLNKTTLNTKLNLKLECIHHLHKISTPAEIQKLLLAKEGKMCKIYFFGSGRSIAHKPPDCGFEKNEKD